MLVHDDFEGCLYIRLNSQINSEFDPDLQNAETNNFTMQRNNRFKPIQKTLPLMQLRSQSKFRFDTLYIYIGFNFNVNSDQTRNDY